MRLSRLKAGPGKKLRVRFYLVGILGLEPGDSISDNPKSTDFQEAGEEPGYIQVCNKGQVT